jgi:hypothetical protein
MRDWKAIAKASGIEIDSVEPLEALEAAFRPLLKDLTPGVEPATELRLEEDAE